MFRTLSSRLLPLSASSIRNPKYLKGPFPISPNPVVSVPLCSNFSSESSNKSAIVGSKSSKESLGSVDNSSTNVDKDTSHMDTTDRVNLTELEWKNKLDKETFKVCRLKGTEYPGSGKYLHHSEKGTYVCICCRAELFRSEDKFNHCGWPSFRLAMNTTTEGNEDASNVKREYDGTLGMERTEVLCKMCDSHLGHVFDDGPEPFGRRFCINSVSLDFVKD